MGKNMKCQVCGEELQFKEYGSKMGKDGRMAKWPIYWPCKNKANHKAISRHGNIKQDPPAPAAPKEKPIRSTRAVGNSLNTAWAGTMYQFEEYAEKELTRFIEQFEDKHGKRPIEIRMDPTTFGEMSDKVAAMDLGIPCMEDATLTDGYKYVLLVERLRR